MCVQWREDDEGGGEYHRRDGWMILTIDLLLSMQHTHSPCPSDDDGNRREREREFDVNCLEK